MFVDADADGLPAPRRPEVEPVCLTRRQLEKTGPPPGGDGVVPEGAAVRFVPERAEPARLPPPDDDKDHEPGGTIFGDDDHYLFHDRSFPWRTQTPSNTTTGDNEYRGGDAFSALLGWARSNFP